MSRRCVILSGGERHPLAGIRPGDSVVACDRGYAYAAAEGVRPDLVISDFDSYGGRVAEDVPVRRLPTEKDDTDTMAAVRFACGEGFDEIVILCALGGRLDHTLANLQALVYAVEHGASAAIESPDTRVSALRDGTLRLPRREGFSLSVFSAADESRVSIRGAKYELEEAVITNAFPLGASNEWRDGEAVIRCHSGVILVVESRL